MEISTRTARILAAAGTLLALAGGAAWYTGLRAELAQDFDRHTAAFAGSKTCRTCHQDHYASWQRTFHRTMTQEASAQSVQGRFDGQVVEYWGAPIRPLTRDGRYFFQYLDPETREPLADVEIKRTVGSHRYQQYLGQVESTGANYHRLHLLWHNADQRWVHMNGAFLHPDAQDFDAHVTTWNHNCIFCHNTGPAPRIRNAESLYRRMAAGEAIDFLDAARYDSQVAELGIACESCHGPGAEHARRNRDFLRRYLLHLDAAADPTIVNPAKLPPPRAAEVCGQCHGQRVPVRTELVERWLATGPTYRAGDELSAHVRLVTAAEPAPANNPDLYRLRFWGDGTPRLSAYELQGLTQSKCFAGGQLGCINCHDAHGGDVNAMMRDDGRSNAPCLACHAPIAKDIPAHTHHAADSPGSQCYACHMPPVVYGVMEIHRSHRIERPDPAAQVQAGRPETCTGCHQDRSAAWAAASIGQWRGAKDSAQDITGLPENARQLFAGDPVQRAVAAKLAGRADTPLNAKLRLAQVPLLIEALDDGYPAVRRFAWLSLKALDAELNLQFGATLARFDFIAAAVERTAVIAELRRQWATRPDTIGINPSLIAALRAQASDKAISIGE